MTAYSADLADRVDDSDPLKFLVVAQTLEEWDDDFIAAADYLLTAWTMRACMSGDRTDISDLETTLRALLERLPASSSLPDILRGRWQGYLALLASRALCLPSEDETQAFLERTYVRDILALLPASGESVAQAELDLGGKLNPLRLSQILGSMADHGLIAPCREEGIKKWRRIDRRIE